MPILIAWNFAEGKVPDGYGTARWQTTILVVLRVMAACTAAVEETALQFATPHVGLCLGRCHACGVPRLGRRARQ